MDRGSIHWSVSAGRLLLRMYSTPDTVESSKSLQGVVGAIEKDVQLPMATVALREK